MEWKELKESVKNILLSRNLKRPQIRLKALDNLESLIKLHFPDVLNHPEKLLEYGKPVFKEKLSNYKKLNSAESSVINNFYQILESSNFIVTKSRITFDGKEKSDEEFSDNDYDLSLYNLLQDRFSKEIEILINLFNKKLVLDNLKRINEIFYKSEEFWKKQLDFIPNRIVKYLLVAEAPPFSISGEILYVYNPKSPPRTLLKAVTKAFWDEYIYKNIGVEETLKLLAQKGFLIIDSLPFAMPYSNKRSNKYYKRLVQSCADTYLNDKINNTNIKWSSDLKIAFSLKRNAEVIIEKYSNGIPFNSLVRNIQINKDLIAVNGAGYPCSNRLKKIFSINYT